MLKYTEEHEWLKIEGDVALVGITAHAAEQLGDLVYVELPAVGASFSKNANAATVESVKAASDVFCPLDGEIVEVNEAIVADPALVNRPDRGRLVLQAEGCRPAEVDGLMDESQYNALIG